MICVVLSKPLLSSMYVAQLQCTTSGECMHQADCMCVHGAQNRDVEDLMRASPDVEFAGREALWDSELWE